MSIRLGHRVGGFYVSAPVTGRNAGRQSRVGHRLPLGFYGSAPISLGARKPRTPATIPAMVFATIVVGGLFGWAAISSGAIWFLIPVLAGIGINWFNWARQTGRINR